MKKLFGELEDFIASRLKVRTLGDISEDVSAFVALNILEGSSVEHFNYDIKKSIKITSTRRDSTMEEVVRR